MNAASVGRSVQTRFSLNGKQGLNIFAAGYPISQQVNCDTSSLIQNVDAMTTAATAVSPTTPRPGSTSMSGRRKALG